MTTPVIYLLTTEKRPDFRLVKTFLWSDEQNVNSDGDSHNPASRDWTLLYLLNREDENEWIDIYPLQDRPLMLEIKGSSENLAARVAYFLAVKSSGQVSFTQEGPYQEPVVLLPLLGHAFDLKAAMERIEKSRYANATEENPYPWLE
ncbi:MAG TPA: hypothetical protein VF600_07220 [Abditibacteriaceae bacterium]|jgi:hypothetical protein